MEEIKNKLNISNLSEEERKKLRQQRFATGNTAISTLDSVKVRIEVMT